MPLLKINVKGGFVSGVGPTEPVTWYFESPLDATRATLSIIEKGLDYDLDTGDFISDFHEFDEWLKQVRVVNPRVESAVAPPPTTPPYRCQFCGQPSWLDESEQTAPTDYCHESDHGSEEIVS